MTWILCTVLAVVVGVALGIIVHAAQVFLRLARWRREVIQMQRDVPAQMRPLARSSLTAEPAVLP